MTTLLTPVLALICLTLLVWIWMYATRIPAIQKAGIDPANAREPSTLNALPMSVRQIGYNYKHLMEQPTIFYALVFYIYLTGHADGLYVDLAWAYVGLRVLHTLIQCTVNHVLTRFSVFTLSSIRLQTWLS